MKLILYSWISASLAFGSVSKAHDLTDLHKSCLDARDYTGCIQYQSININSTNEVDTNNKYWRTYGPLMVNWSAWRIKDGNFVAPAINSSGKNLFIAANCAKNKINVTGIDRKWKGWLLPVDQFEFELLANLCDKN